MSPCFCRISCRTAGALQARAALRVHVDQSAAYREVLLDAGHHGVGMDFSAPLHVGDIGERRPRSAGHGRRRPPFPGTACAPCRTESSAPTRRRAMSR
uniref:Uncharacterized protein n=1 Tax=Arundo donax TaxID=35708 RepID=A0A0A9H582_ARUDO